MLTVIEAPSRLAYTMTVTNNSYSMTFEYTILPDGNGSLVRLEAEGRSAASPIFGMLLGAIKESGIEKENLASLKAAMEAPAQPQS